MIRWNTPSASGNAVIPSGMTMDAATATMSSTPALRRRWPPPRCRRRRRNPSRWRQQSARSPRCCRRRRPSLGGSRTCRRREQRAERIVQHRRKEAPLFGAAQGQRHDRQPEQQEAQAREPGTGQALGSRFAGRIGHPRVTSRHQHRGHRQGDRRAEQTGEHDQHERLGHRATLPPGTNARAGPNGPSVGTYDPAQCLFGFWIAAGDGLAPGWRNHLSHIGLVWTHRKTPGIPNLRPARPDRLKVVLTADWNGGRS